MVVHRQVVAIRKIDCGYCNTVRLGVPCLEVKGSHGAEEEDGQSGGGGVGRREAAQTPG